VCERDKRDRNREKVREKVSERERVRERAYRDGGNNREGEAR